MKNKKFTYLLIGLVALIWSFFFYMLFSGNSPQTEQQVVSYEPIELGNDSIIFKKLNLSYKDPFLARNIVSREFRGKVSVSNTKVKPKKQKTAVNIPKPAFVWPRVEYGGTLNDDKGLVTLNNSLVIAEEGKVVNEFTILNIYPDSIRISYKEKTKVFFKNK